MFWIDELTKQVLKYQKKSSYQINDYKTPSGKIHIGSLRGVVLHNAIKQGLEKVGKKANFTYGFDDYDPMDGFPPELNSSFKKYMGFPLSEIPSPEKGYKSFAEYYAKDFLKVFNNMGILPKIIWTSELYKKGVFDKAIKIALENKDKILRIYSDISGSKKEKWYPYQAICEKCGKIGTTITYDYKNDKVYYECKKDSVKWAKGCGHKGVVSPYKGAGKLPWKIEWAAKWYALNYDIEGAGKDHMTKSGSHDVASAVAEKIYQIKPPFSFAYEWFLLGGRKMSTSKGVGHSAADIAKILPSEILKFLNIRPKYKKTIDFNPEGTSIPTLYDDFIRCFQYYQKDKKSDLGQAYYYSKININEKDPEYLMRFSKIAIGLQMPRINLQKLAREEKGKKLTQQDKVYLERWIKFAKIWLKHFAPKEFKFEIQEKMPKTDLTKSQKIFLKKVLQTIENQNLSGDKLHQEIHKIKTDLKINPRDAFSVIYLIFLGKESGPQAGWFLANLNKNFVIKRIKQAIK